MLRPTTFVVLAGIVLATAAVGFSSRSSDNSAPYALVNANKGNPPTLVASDGMQSVRRVGPGRYCLQSSTTFAGKVVGQVTTDLGLSGGSPGIAVIDTGARFCHATELAVVTYRFGTDGRLRLSNTISFIGDPEG